MIVALIVVLIVALIVGIAWIAAPAAHAVADEDRPDDPPYSEWPS